MSNIPSDPSSEVSAKYKQPRYEYSYARLNKKTNQWSYVPANSQIENSISKEQLAILQHARQGDVIEITEKGAYKKVGKKWVELLTNTEFKRESPKIQKVIRSIKTTFEKVFKGRISYTKDEFKESFVKDVVKKESFFSKKTDFVLQVKVLEGEEKRRHDFFAEQGLSETKMIELDSFLNRYTTTIKPLRDAKQAAEADPNNKTLIREYNDLRIKLLPTVNSLNKEFKKKGGEKILMQLKEADNNYAGYLRNTLQDEANAKLAEGEKSSFREFSEPIIFLNEIYKDFTQT